MVLSNCLSIALIPKSNSWLPMQATSTLQALKLGIIYSPWNMVLMRLGERMSPEKMVNIGTPSAAACY